MDASAACRRTYRLPYPVWRARDLPFGRGLLSLPQRSESALEMYEYDAPGDSPVERFEGHAGECTTTRTCVKILMEDE
jgi:hypothetical protein